LSALSHSLNIHIITADTYGSVRIQIQDENISLHVLTQGDQCRQKSDFVTQLGAFQTVAIGNGYNDHLMLSEAIIGIAVIREEGLSRQALAGADLVFTSIVDALDCLKNPMRLIASLRR